MGDLLKKLRLEHNFTQTELSDELNVPHQTISRWENNLSTPSFEMVINIAKVYGISISTFDTSLEKGAF